MTCSVRAFAIFHRGWFLVVFYGSPTATGEWYLSNTGDQIGVLQVFCSITEGGFLWGGGRVSLRRVVSKPNMIRNRDVGPA